MIEMTFTAGEPLKVGYIVYLGKGGLRRLRPYTWWERFVRKLRHPLRRVGVYPAGIGIVKRLEPDNKATVQLVGATHNEQ